MKSDPASDADAPVTADGLRPNGGPCKPDPSKTEILARLRQRLAGLARQILETAAGAAAGTADQESGRQSSPWQGVQDAAKELLQLINQQIDPAKLVLFDTLGLEATPAGDVDAGGGGLPLDEDALDRRNAPARILVVDDSDIANLVLAEELRREGHLVEQASDGRQAMELIRSRSFDLVLLDIEMPVMDGYAVLAELKRDRALRHIPVLMVTGREEIESVVKCIELGAVDHLNKAADPVLLRARIGACLEKKRSHDQEQWLLQKLQIERERSERLLLNILPRPIVERLKQGEKTIAESYLEVTILFADLVGFTELSSRTGAAQLVQMLNQIFSAFDRLAERHGLEKIKTIGDAYMVAGGLPWTRQDHAVAVADMALDMVEEIRRFNRLHQTSLDVRVGINTGPVMAGIIGEKKFIYDLWGDAVNTASRMESHGRPSCIQVSESVFRLIEDRYRLESRGLIEVKGKGQMVTWWLNGRREASP